MNKNKAFLSQLDSHKAQDDMIDFVKQHGYSWKYFYNNCPKGEWLLWLFGRTSLSKANNDYANEKIFTFVKGHCANTVREKITKECCFAAIDAAIAYGENKISKEELDIIARHAFTDYDTEYFANFAAFTAACDMYSEEPAIYSARAANNKEENERLTADICRKYLPIEIWRMEFLNITWFIK